MSSSILYKKYLSFPLSNIKLNFPATLTRINKVNEVNFNKYPESIQYTKHINPDTIYLVNTTNPLNIINFFTYSKYYKIEQSKFPFLSYISDFYSYEYKDFTPTGIYSVDYSSISITDQHRFKKLHFKPFSNTSLNTISPYLISKGTSLKILHKQILSFNEVLHFNLQTIFTDTPKKKQLLIQLYNYNKSKLLWGNYNLINKLPYSNGLLTTLFSACQSPGKAIDITSGLQTIENIFESRSNSDSNYLISKNVSILNQKILQYYNKATKDYIVNSFTHSLEAKELNWITTSSKIPLYTLENNYSIIYGGQVLSTGKYAPSNIINHMVTSKKTTQGQYSAVKQSLFFAMNLIIDSLLNQYLFQGISLPSIHFELMAKKMTSCVKIVSPGDLTITVGNILPLTLIETLNLASKFNGFRMCTYTPIILGITKSTIATSGFLSSISFQETLKLLGKAALYQSTDWLTDLKSKIIATDLIPSGTGWLRYFNKI